MPVALIYDPIFLKHDTGPGHPECARRLRSILEHLHSFDSRLLWLEPPEASTDLLCSVHSYEQIERVETAAMGGYPLDADTQTSPDSYVSALMAAGAGICGIDALRRGEASSAFAAVRPPGHHATAERSMGFCLFNNIAIAARYAQSVGYEKVFIIDFDVHHGNGTQEIFYSDATVFYFSTHQYPAYPGSGAVDETGIAEGEGYTANFPLGPGSGDDEILPIYENELPACIENFAPDIVLVSAGYDLHRSDPLASLQVSTEGIARIVEAIMASSQVPKLFFLEGGYHIEALGECVARTIRVMQEYAD